MRRVRVVGVGSLQGDDAVGLLAVRAARAELERLGVEVHEVRAAARLLDLLRGADAAIVVDAVQGPGIAAGEVVRLEAGPAGLPTGIATSLSSHGLGVAEVLALLAAAGEAPRVVVLGVGVTETRAGARLSDRVLRSVPELVTRVVVEARLLSRR